MTCVRGQGCARRAAHVLEDQDARGHARTFISDMTMPDGSVCAPNMAFVKVWRMRNEGDCA